MNDSIAYTPQQVMQRIIEAGEKRNSQPIVRCILLGLLAGAFISFGAATSSVAAHGITDTGLARLATAVVFPVGLMMIVLVGGELFTGDCLMVTGIWDKKYGIMVTLRTLIVVWISNLAGSIIMSFIVANSGIYSYSNGALGAYMIKIAYGKCGMEPVTAFCSGILCNMLVCAAVLMSGAAKTAAGKIWTVFFPIMAFVVGGFEHCVANMFYIPAGMFAALNDSYVEKAADLYGISAAQIRDQLSAAGFMSNIIPVTLGNIVGAVIFMALPLYYVYKKAR